MPTAMGFSARMGAGKTSVSTRVAETLQAPRASFGAYVLKTAKLQGRPETREALQDLGESLVQKDVHDFCVRVLEDGGWKQGMSVIVDGVRHLSVLDTLRAIVQPDYFGLVYLNINQVTQRKRWANEDLPHKKPLAELEQHPTEIEVLTVLLDKADLVLDSSRPLEDVVRDVLRFSHLIESSSGFGDWTARNHRRVELVQRKNREGLTAEEQEEFELLQQSFFEYLATKHPQALFQSDELDEIESRLRGNSAGDGEN